MTMMNIILVIVLRVAARRCFLFRWTRNYKPRLIQQVAMAVKKKGKTVPHSSAKPLNAKAKAKSSASPVLVSAKAKSAAEPVSAKARDQLNQRALLQQLRPFSGRQCRAWGRRCWSSFWPLRLPCCRG